MHVCTPSPARTTKIFGFQTFLPLNCQTPTSLLTLTLVKLKPHIFVLSTNYFITIFTLSFVSFSIINTDTQSFLISQHADCHFEELQQEAEMISHL